MDPASMSTPLHVLELLGICAFALSGAMTGIRKGFDLVGILLLATLTALGGGVIRDVVIGATPPAAFRSVDYLAVAGAAAIVAMVAHPAVERVYRLVLVLDAVGLGLFCTTGALIAHRAGLGPVPAVLLGVVTAVGGGVLRDVVALEVPLLVRADSDLYAVPATLGAAAVVTLEETGTYEPVWGGVVAAGVLLLRLAAMRWDWRAPTARVVGVPPTGAPAD